MGIYGKYEKCSDLFRIPFALYPVYSFVTVSFSSGTFLLCRMRVSTESANDVHDCTMSLIARSDHRSI